MSRINEEGTQLGCKHFHSKAASGDLILEQGLKQGYWIWLARQFINVISDKHQLVSD